MSRIFIDGFESGNTDLWDTCSMSISTFAGKSGSYCLTGVNQVITKQITPISEVYIAFKFYSTGSWNNIVSFNNGGTNLGLVYRNSDGTISLCWSSSGNVISTGAITPVGVWSLFEVYYLPHLTAGTFILKINGVVYATATGVKTAPSTSNITTIGFATSMGWTSYFDDIIFDDANWIGDTAIQKLAVTGAGATTQWDPSTGSNWDCVDAIPAADSTWVSTNVSGEVDTYTLANLDGTINSVKAVQVQARCQKGGALGKPNIKMVIQYSGEHDSANKVVTAFAPKSVANVWNTNPNTSTPWTEPNVNAIEIGIRAES